MCEPDGRELRDKTTSPGAVTPAEKLACAKTSNYDCKSFLRWYYHDIPVNPDCPSAGTLADGASCTVDEQCQSGQCTTGFDGPGCGQCIDPPASYSPCLDGVYCGHASMCLSGAFEDPTCIPLSDEGQGCVLDACLVDLACIEGVCQEPSPVGADCDEQGGTGCPHNTYCQATTNTCVKPVLSAIAQGCGVLPDGTVAVCEAGSKCAVNDIDTYEGVCVPVAEKGDPCEVGTFFVFGYGTAYSWTCGVNLFCGPAGTCLSNADVPSCQ